MEFYAEILNTPEDCCGSLFMDFDPKPFDWDLTDKHQEYTTAVLQPSIVEPICDQSIQDMASMYRIHDDVPEPQREFTDLSQPSTQTTVNEEMPPVLAAIASSEPTTVFNFTVNANGELQFCTPVTPATPVEQPTTTTTTKKTTKVRKTLTKTPLVPGEWHCGQCNRNFLSSKGLMQHNKSQHTGVKAHRCDECGKKFDLAEDRDRHQQRHVAGNKAFPCPLGGCSRAYNTRFDLNRHIRETHDGTAMFECTQCENSFVRKDHLLKHERSHKNETVKKCKKKRVVKVSDKKSEE